MIFVCNVSKNSLVTSRGKKAVHLVDKTNNQLLCYGNKLLSPAIQFQRMELCLLTTISCPSGLTFVAFCFIHPSLFLLMPFLSQQSARLRLYHRQGTLCTAHHFQQSPAGPTRDPRSGVAQKSRFVV